MLLHRALLTVSNVKWSPTWGVNLVLMDLGFICALGFWQLSFIFSFYDISMIEALFSRKFVNPSI